MDARRQRPLALFALAAILFLPARALALSGEPYFLIATRDLHDPVFSESVILMLPVGEDGLVKGVIINKPTTISVQTFVSGAPVLPKPSGTAFFGGPVDVNTPIALLRAARPPAGAVHVFDDVYLVDNPAQIDGYLKAPPEANGVRLIVGRAQWMPDQLMAEIAEGSWYQAPAEADAVFSIEPAKIWESLVKRGELQEADARGKRAGTLQTSPAVAMFGRGGAGGRLNLFDRRASESYFSRLSGLKPPVENIICERR